jgi:hypothetical protein
VNGARVLAGLAAVAAVGCLWLYPIQRDDTNSSNTATGMGVSTTSAGAAGTAGTSVMTENEAGQCITNEDCGDPSMTYICRAHKCVALKSEDCLVLLGKWNDPNAFIFGAYAYYNPNNPAMSQPIYNYDLAIKELNDPGGLPDINALNDAGGLLDGGGTRHPLAAVVCNNDPAKASDPNFYRGTLLHLIDDIGVSAIIADLPPKDLMNAFDTTRMEGKSVFLLSPGAATSDLLKLPDDGLVWNMIGPPSDLAEGYADLVGRIEKYVQSHTDAGTTPLRVAAVVKDDPNDAHHQLWTELWGAVKPQLKINGFAVTDNRNAANYREFSIDANKDGGAPEAVGNAVNDFVPHIVISMVGDDFTKRGLLTDHSEGVAQSIVTQVNGNVSPREWVQHEYPFFILSPINVVSTTELNQLLTSSTGVAFKVLYERLLGINVGGADDRDVLNDYTTRLRNFNKDAVDGLENYYDSIYYLAYAVYAEGVEPIDGPKINKGMSQLNTGKREKVGPDGIEAVFRDLKTGTIQLSGAGGSKFDTQTGARKDKAGIFCFHDVNGTPNARYPAEIFDPETPGWVVLPMYAGDDAMMYPDPCAPGL